MMFVYLTIWTFDEASEILVECWDGPKGSANKPQLIGIS